MKLTAIPTFRSENGHTVQFFPVTDKVLRLTSSHRVVINGLAVDWLSSDFKPSAKTARFYLEKHNP